jgi:tetratricopeptide (TPR) repeat protein
LACIVFMLPLAWLGIRVTKELWPVYYNKQQPLSTDARIKALGEAIRIWPNSELHMDRAKLLHELAIQSKPPESVEQAMEALADYEAAEKINPNDPVFAINQAIILSKLGETATAESAFHKAIELQGGMEAGFRGHYCYAAHLLRKGIALLEKGDKKNALVALEKSNAEIEQVQAQGAGYSNGDEGRNLRVNILELLGAAHESNGNNKKALECYNFATTLPMGNRANYRAGALIGRMARDAWYQRNPPLALALFMEARERIAKAGANLPYGATATRRAELMKYFEESIKFLKAAKVVPKK